MRWWPRRASIPALVSATFARDMRPRGDEPAYEGELLMRTFGGTFQDISRESLLAHKFKEGTPGSQALIGRVLRITLLTTAGPLRSMVMLERPPMQGRGCSNGRRKKVFKLNEKNGSPYQNASRT